MDFIKKLIAEAKAAYDAAIAKEKKVSDEMTFDNFGRRIPSGRKLTDAERIEIRKLFGKSLALKEQADQALKDKGPFINKKRNKRSVISSWTIDTGKLSTDTYHPARNERSALLLRQNNVGTHR